MTPVSGCLPWLHAGSSLSMEFRAGGMIIDAWPSVASVMEVARSMVAVPVAVAVAVGWLWWLASG